MIKPLFILGFSQKSLPSRLIQWWTRSKFNHVALVYNPYKCLIIESRFGEGVSINPIDKHVKPNDEIYIYYIFLPKNKYNQIMNFLVQRIGAKYDWTGILGFIFKMDIEDRYKFFCSELIYDAFLAANIHLLNADSGFKIDPQTLLYSPFLKFFKKFKVNQKETVCFQLYNTIQLFYKNQ